MIQKDKKTLRQELLANRLKMTDDKRQTLNYALHDVLQQYFLTRNDQTIAGYWPIRGEFDPIPYLTQWQQAKAERTIVLPVVEPRQKQLAFHTWSPDHTMEPNTYGIPEPKSGIPVIPDVLLIPCVGYAKGGYRLGYGGGFYDRTLASIKKRPLTVGLAYSYAYIPDFVPGLFDIPLDVILTEGGVVGCTNT
jgi:5-formyltetrahydrofolate cyclo-ligase